MMTDSRTRPETVRFLSALLLFIAFLWPLAVSPAASQTAVSPSSGGGEASDLIVTKEGKSLVGEVLSMGNGEISYQTPEGLESVPIEKVGSFQIRRGEKSTVDENTLQAILNNQSRIMEQLALMTQSLANLERRLLNVQTGQAVTQQRLTDRTVEVDPLSRVVVLDYNINRRSGNTVVSGRVANQSESVVSNLQVQVVAFGAKGRLGTMGGQMNGTGPVQPSVLAPGQVGRFEVDFKQFLLVENVQVNVLGFPPFGGLPLQSPGRTFGEY